MKDDITLTCLAVAMDFHFLSRCVERYGEGDAVMYGTRGVYMGGGTDIQ